MTAVLQEIGFYTVRFLLSTPSVPVWVSGEWQWYRERESEFRHHLYILSHTCQRFIRIYTALIETRRCGWCVHGVSGRRFLACLNLRSSYRYKNSRYHSESKTPLWLYFQSVLYPTALLKNTTPSTTTGFAPTPPTTTIQGKWVSIQFDIYI